MKAKNLFILSVLLVVGCSNISLTKNNKEYGFSGRHEVQVNYTTNPSMPGLILSSSAIDDVATLNKPVNLASSTEFWFW